MTKTDWTAEEVRERAEEIRSEYGLTVVPNMLTAFANRIEADEIAVPVNAEVVAIVRSTDIGDKYLDWTIEGSLDALEVGDAIYCVDINTPEDGAAELFTHPPAQPAQMDRARETPRRQQAVGTLLELGWTYNVERGWEGPAQEQSGWMVPNGCIPVPRSLVERWANVDAFNAPTGAAMELKAIAGQMLLHAAMLAASPTPPKEK